jgi:hypothetical protein
MVMQLPDDDELSRTKMEYFASITVSMGGRAVSSFASFCIRMSLCLSVRVCTCIHICTHIYIRVHIYALEKFGQAKMNITLTYHISH